MTDLLDGNGMSAEDLSELAYTIGGGFSMKPRHRRSMMLTLHRLAREAEPGDVFAIDIRKVRL